MKPICVPCQRFFRPKKNGYPFIEATPTGDSDEAFPGKATPERWKPYKLWLGDKWECEGCHAEIVVGVAQAPRAEHYEPEFESEVAYYKPELQVNDC